MAKRNDYHRDGPSAEDRALERFTELMIEKISTLQKDWSKPWFTEGMMKWPKNLTGREYNGMNALMLALEWRSGLRASRVLHLRCGIVAQLQQEEGRLANAIDERERGKAACGGRAKGREIVPGCAHKGCMLNISLARD